jgi:PASTA domain/Bacterial Ig-like domain (group 2)/PKD domain
MTTIPGKILVLLAVLTLVAACGGGGSDQGSKSVVVPNVVGQTESAATAAIVGAGLQVGGSTSTSSGTFPAGSVVSQNPAAGTMMRRGSPVSLVVSSGTPAQTVQSMSVVPASASIGTGATLQLNAKATYEDGHSEDVTSRALWSSGTPSVATVSASGLVTALESGATAISARLGAVSGASALTVTANVAPVANAGPSQNVVPGTVVTLDGSSSSDANGDVITYAWTMTSRPIGSAATLTATSSVKPTFVADIRGVYVIELIVSDRRLNSSPASVSITAAEPNVAPVANAGPAQDVVPGTVVTLDGSSSSDANGDPLSFVWSLERRPRLSAAVLTFADTPSPTFKADVAGTYGATLIVNDGKVDSALAYTSVSAGTEGIPGQGTWETTLRPRDLDGDGLADAYYDTAQDITWLADRTLPRLTLSEANSWVASLNVHGVTGWRLFNVQTSPLTSELSKLYFDTLGNVVMNWSNVGPFWFITPLESHMPPPPGWYWSGTPAFTDGASESNWGFSLGILEYIYFDASSRLWVWPVRTGDVAAASATAASD